MSILAGVVSTAQTMTKIRGNFIYYFIAVVCTTAFFIHEFIPNDSEDYINAVNNFNNAKQEKKIALQNLNDNAKGTELHKTYLERSTKADKLWDEFLAIEKQDSFLGFKNLQQFIGEFGWAFGLFLYSIFNLIITFIKSSDTKYGEIILHSTLNFISLYFVSWALQQSRPDYGKGTYVVYSILMSLSIVWGTSKLVKYKVKYIKSLFSNIKDLNIKDLIGFMFDNTKEESEEKMWDVLKGVKHGRK